MKIRLNGNVAFDNFDVTLLDNDLENNYLDDYIVGDYEELMFLDEYLNDMIEDYANIISNKDVELHNILAAMIYELFELWFTIDTD